ncbi:D-tyrosyl-tRNA(Tyr) deacylase [Deinobacterium chartae]|uniref:D-aminoacyl-tRNA deacylase n=1 Tax=Deinobacterium chartae TaxID=521158 RepID=A0A841HWN3_9DEIO|nr:D-aminoacyl-tRNA deacylase [Deinobacterium chartae]MBB6097941.1 D-tyrosyl-tRNA(Tyr) deacylase [Deinobacterium chartae]
MRVLLQRVSRASVRVDGEVTGEIGPGLLLLVGVGEGDHEADARALAEKIAKLRIFSDDAGKMNLNVQQVGGRILSVSQFTLYADTRRGNRPSFTDAAAPQLGRELWQSFNACLRELGLEVEEGVFAADMQVELVNDGPVTLWLDSRA